MKYVFTVILHICILTILIISTANAESLPDKLSQLVLDKQYDQAVSILNNIDALGGGQSELRNRMRDFIDYYRTFNKMYDDFKLFVSNPDNKNKVFEHYVILGYYFKNMPNPIPLNRDVANDINSKMKIAKADADQIKKIIDDETRKSISYKIGDSLKSCDDLTEMQQAVVNGNHQYFKAWKESDFDHANILYRECEHKPGDFFVKEKDLFHEERTKLLQDKQKNVHLCHSGNKYILYNAQEEIIGDNEQKAGCEANMAKERLIARESGVRNLSAAYSNGECIVTIKQDIKENWVIYKKLGGKASSPGNIKHTLKNPCESEENEAVPQKLGLDYQN
jgi:hypothetical protein